MGRELIGYVPVDAGLMYVGDPCYVLGSDASSAASSWMDWLAEVWPATFGTAKVEGDKDESLSVGYYEPKGDKSKPTCTGIAVSSGYGDGCYPVYVEWAEANETGGWGRRVKSVTVEFIGIEEGDDDEYEEEQYYCDSCGTDLPDDFNRECDECRENGDGE